MKPILTRIALTAEEYARLKALAALQQVDIARLLADLARAKLQAAGATVPVRETD